MPPCACPQSIAPVITMNTQLFTHIVRSRRHTPVGVCRLLVVLLFAAATVCRAQTALQWIAPPHEEGVTQAWLRKAYTGVGDVREAVATVATTGYVRLYVNGRLADPSPLVPARGAGDTAAKALRYDVTASVVRADSLVLALWCAPAESATAEVPAVALRLWLRTDDGGVRVIDTDSTWLCRPAAVQLDSLGRETTDGRQWHATWSYGDTDWALWRGAVAVGGPDTGRGAGHAALPSGYEPPAGSGSFLPRASFRGADAVGGRAAGRITEILTPVTTRVEDGRLVCRFARPFVGFVRVTLRGAARGGRISVGGMGYVCSGELDEQVQGRFRLAPWSVVEVSGDRRFRPSQVVGVEGLVVGGGTD